MRLIRARDLFRPAALGGLVLAAVFGSQRVEAQEASFDRRASMGLEGATPGDAQLQAIAELQNELGGSLLATFDDLTGVTRTLMHPLGKLTAPATGAPTEIAVSFVRSHLDLLGLEEGDLRELEVCDVVPSRVTGATHVHLCQRLLGIPVLNAQLQVNVAADGSITGVSNSFVPSLDTLLRAADASAEVDERRIAGADDRGGIAAGIEAPDAVVAAARHLGVSLRRRPLAQESPRGTRRSVSIRADELSRELVAAELVWLPVGRGLRLAYRVQVHTLDGRHVFAMAVDATGGSDPSDPSRVLTRFDMVSDAQYRVYPRPVESPNHSTPLPPTDARVLVVDPADSIASPLGWQNTGTQTFTILRGNNVHAYDDKNADNVPPTSQPSCTSSSCSFSINLAADPTTYTAASLTNAFYWTNLVHDIQYRYGFDEAAGNFQVNNFGRGGAANDALLAEVQDGGGENNANMFTPADGSRPRMQMYLWTLTTPRADGGLDAGVIVHEYGHGISNRLVGGPSNVLCLTNSQQPGEGLSDWWALAYTARAGDTGAMPRGIGTYVLGEPTDGDGIRTQRYSTDPAVNTHTYESIAGKAIPHGVGEVWAQAAWEVYWALVDRYGFDSNLANASGGAGNQRMMLYVNEGLKATACNPTFTDVRDGILQAAMSLHGGEDVCHLWRAFAAFGLGVNAVSGGPSSTSPTNGFDIPAACDPGPRMISPPPGSTLTGTDVTFQWDSNGVPATDYELLIGSSAGQNDIYQSGSLGTSLSVTVTGLPADGRTLYLRLRFLAGGTWDFKDFTYRAAVRPPAMVAPPPGSTLGGADATFEWIANGTPSLAYWIYVGTTFGGNQLHDSGSLGPNTLSHSVTGLPRDGRTLYVRLYWLVTNGGWQFADYTYTANNTPLPQMVSPSPGSTLSGADVVFSWSDNGAAVELWRLTAGSTQGGEQYFASAPLTTLSVLATGLPRNGTTVHVRLHFQIAGAWSFRDFTYTAATATPEIYSPVPGTTLPGATVTFQWRSNGAPIGEWWLYLGSSIGARDILDTGSVGASTSRTVSGLPTDGRTIHARLWYRQTGMSWFSVDFAYVAATVGTPGTPTVTSPTPGSTLPGASATFVWTANGAPVSQWWVHLGTTSGASNIFDSGNLGSTTTLTVTNLPTDGNPVYLKLWYLLSGTWQSTVFQYATSNASPTIQSPAPGSTFSGTNVTFTWQAPEGQAVAEYQLYLGTAAGASDLYNSGSLGLATFVTVNGLPTDGRTIYARLFYRVGTLWRFSNHAFTAANLPNPTITSPMPGSVLPGPTATFEWAPYPGAEPVTEWWLYVGSTPGAWNYLDSGSLGLNRSRVVSTLPVNGSTVHVRLWYKIFGRWEFTDFQYTAFLP
jgi:extracellular elastinolytic metalloproteinase